MNSLIDIQQFQRFDNLEFIARQVVEGFITGLHKSPFHGFSVEFAEHRLYNTGESTKHIDWKLFAKTDKLFVKRFEEETNLRSHLIIDTSSSMYFPHDGDITKTKIGFAVYAAAALVYLLKKQRDAVGLSLFSEAIELHTPTKMTNSHAKLLYGYLDSLLQSDYKRLNKKTNAAKQLHLLADSMHKRSLILLFSDMMNSDNLDDIFAALQHLRYNKHEVVLFHIVDKQRESEFNYENRPYKFVDMETGEEIKLNPNDLRDSYTEQLDKFHNQLKLKCGHYKIDFVPVDINQNFREILLPYLIKRSSLY